jgi:hypothetical protein
MNRVFAWSMAMSRRAVTPSAGALAPALRGLDRRVRKRHLLEFAQGLFDLQIGVGQGRPSPAACRFTKSEVVYNGFRSDHRQDPKAMKKAIPSLYPSWLFSWLYKCCRT